MALPDPEVSPDAYDDAYYRGCCAGYCEWAASEGSKLAGIYPGFLIRAGLTAGEVVVDIGTGRAELPVVAVAMGAEHAYGIEYSPAAVRLAAQTLEKHDVGDRAEIFLADARAVPLPDGVADLVCMVDVVEHLAPAELHAALGEAHRLLKPTGRLVVHTAPNRLVYDVTYPALRLLAGRRWAPDPRSDVERLMHVNEHSARSLKRALRAAGFEAEVELGAWVYTDFVPSTWAKRVYKALSRLGPLARFGIADLWATGRPSRGTAPPPRPTRRASQRSRC